VRRVFVLVRGLYTAASGALVAQSQADTIANNLANVNTSGFKRTLLQVQAGPEMGVYALQTQPGSAPGNGVPGSTFIGALGSGAQVLDTPAVFEQGSLQNTGNSLDLGIMGQGFFTIQTPQGILVTMDGNRVIGRNGPIQLQAGDVQIGEDGAVHQNGQAVDQLRIVNFQNLTAVRPEGDNQFIDTGAGRPVADATSTVQQGYLERSNANVVRSMVDLITAQRWFEANQKVIQTQDTLNGYAIQNVAKSNGQ
jgi:flagellar basal-body rod protein FlgF